MIFNGNTTIYPFQIGFPSLTDNMRFLKNTQLNVTFGNVMYRIKYLFLYLRTFENTYFLIFCDILSDLFQIPLPLFSSVLTETPLLKKFSSHHNDFNTGYVTCFRKRSMHRRNISHIWTKVPWGRLRFFFQSGPWMKTP